MGTDGTVQFGDVRLRCKVSEDEKRLVDVQPLLNTFAPVTSPTLIPDGEASWLECEGLADWLKAEAKSKGKGRHRAAWAFVEIRAAGLDRFVVDSGGESDMNRWRNTARNCLYEPPQQVKKAKKARRQGVDVKLYAIRDTVTQAIKFGVSHNPAKRLQALQTANPHPLELVGAVNGSLAMESAVHARLAADRMSGEWFRGSPDVLRFAESLAHGFQLTIEDLLPETEVE